MLKVSAATWNALSQLLDEAFNLEPAARAVWLAELAESQPQLAPTVRKMLAAYTSSETDDFLVRSPRLASLLNESRLTALTAGARVGPYRLKRELGAGGMADVWLAERADGAFTRDVALKLPMTSRLRRDLAERFARERDILARLEHPHIARLYDAGVSEDGLPYLAMEYVDGLPITQYCDAHKLDIAARLRLFGQVLDAVQFAHASLVIHRDLKPSNILVTASGEVRLLDFGIAKLLAENDTALETHLTQMAGRAFTPDYASPEQIKGEPLTIATDVYSLGIVLYELLAGCRPYRLKVLSAAQLENAILATEPSKPSSALTEAAAHARGTTVSRLSRMLSGDLDNILYKALKKSPDERYQTVNALADDLQRYLGHEPVAARPDSLGYRVGKFVRRNRLAVGAATVTLFALLAGVVATTWQALEARRAQSLAEANAAEAEKQREAAQFEARVARANHEFVSQVFGDAMRAGESNEMRAQLDRARELLRKRYADDPVVHSLLLFQVAGRYAELREHKRTAEIMREIETLSMQANDPSLSAMVECAKAYFLLMDGKNDAARPHVAEGLRLMEDAVRLIPQAGFECYRVDAMLASATGEHARGVARMERWLGQLERDGLGKTRAYLNSLASLAYIHYKAGELVPALAVARRARALNEALGSEATLSSQTELDLEADLLFQLGRMSEATEVDREMLKRFAESGAAPPPTFVLKPAWHAIIGGNAEDGVVWMQSALPKYERDGPEGVARALTLDIAAALVVQARYPEARSMVRRYEARLANGPARPRDRVDAARVGVELALATGNAGALGTTLNALEAALTAGGVSRLVSLRGYLAAGLGQLAHGNPGKARAHAEGAMKLATAKVIDGQSSAWVGAAELLLARVALAQGDRAEAREHLTVAAEQFADTLHSGHRWRMAVDSLTAKL